MAPDHLAHAPASCFNWPVRVYYEDTDAGGVVFYANYLKFFERARTEWLRARGIHQHDLLQSHGVVFVVKRCGIDYHAPARLDDELNITAVVERVGRASVQFQQQAWRMNGEQRLLCAAQVQVVCVDGASFRPCPIPENVLQSITTPD